MNIKLMNYRFLAFFGFILILPALILVFAGLSHQFLGYSGMLNWVNFQLFFFHPVVVMGGLAAAFLLNALAIVEVSSKKDTFFRLRPHISLLNVWIILFCIFFTSVIFIYLLAENL